MMNAYSELYLEEAKNNLGDFLDYTVNTCHLDAGKVFSIFAGSKVGYEFGCGNPKYIAGMSGVELAAALHYEVTGSFDIPEPDFGEDLSKEYWAGWALAEYQWYKNVSFAELDDCQITAPWAIDRYILHEADISKFIQVADDFFEHNKKQEQSRLKRLRKYAQLTQKELSARSGVTLRMIQLYEQGQNDLTKASAGVVYALARALGCGMEDLMM